MSKGITEANFAESGKTFSSILLFIATVGSGVKKSVAIFISFRGIVSIPGTLYVSRQLIRFLISGGVTGLKKNFSFRKKFCSLNFFSIYFMLGWVGFLNI